MRVLISPPVSKSSTLKRASLMSQDVVPSVDQPEKLKDPVADVDMANNARLIPPYVPSAALQPRFLFSLAAIAPFTAGIATVHKETPEAIPGTKN